MEEPSSTTPHEEDGLHRPVGTALIMGLYMLAMVGAWLWIFLLLEGRS